MDTAQHYARKVNRLNDLGRLVTKLP